MGANASQAAKKQLIVEFTNDAVSLIALEKVSKAACHFEENVMDTTGHKDFVVTANTRKVPSQLGRRKFGVLLIFKK